MKKLIFFVLILALLFVQGCSQKIDPEDIIVMPQKNPEIEETIEKDNNNIELYGTNNNNFRISNQSRNSLSNYYFIPPGRILDIIPQNIKWLDFQVYNRYIFLISKTGETEKGLEYGNKISIFDTEGQFQSGTFGEIDSLYTSMTEYKGYIYIYDYSNGHICKYNSKGMIESTYYLKSDLDIKKLIFSEEGWLIALVNEEGNKNLWIFDDKFKLKSKIKFSSTERSGNNIVINNPVIFDFDIYDKNHIILKTSDGKLCLYNLKNGEMKKERYVGNDSNLICYSSNILYWTEQRSEGILASNSSQIAYISPPQALGRLFLNKGFPWDTNESLDDWTLEPFEMPGNLLKSVHYRMKSWERFIYILDYNMEPSDKNFQSFIIRVEK